MPAISKENEFIFMDIPKTGSVSIFDYLRRHFPDCVMSRHGDFTVPDFSREFFCFSVVRNPYDRMVSLWRYASKNKDNFLFLDKEDFLFFILNSKSDLIENCSIYDIINRFFTDSYKIKFIRFENILEDFNSLPFVKVKNDIKHLNKSNRKKDWREYMTPEIESILWERYKKDFEFFDYPRYNI